MPDTVEEDLTTLAELVPFDRLALLGGRSLFAALSDVAAGPEFQMTYGGAHMQVVVAGRTVHRPLRPCRTLWTPSTYCPYRS